MFEEYTVKWSAALAHFLIMHDIPAILQRSAQLGYGGVAITPPLPTELRSHVANLQYAVFQPYHRDYNNWMNQGYYMKLSRRGEIVCMLRAFPVHTERVTRRFPSFEIPYVSFVCICQRGKECTSNHHIRYHDASKGAPSSVAE